jgi:hypothetical protein
MIQGFRKGAEMSRDLFWLTDEQFSKIEPHLPTGTRGKARIDCPEIGRRLDLGSTRHPNVAKENALQRYVRWAEKGVWAICSARSRRPTDRPRRF